MVGERWENLVEATGVVVENSDVVYTNRYRPHSEHEPATIGAVASEQVSLRLEKDGSLLGLKRYECWTVTNVDPG